MNVNRFLKVTDGDALAALQRFLVLLWEQNELDAVLGPIVLSDPGGVKAQLLHSPAEFSMLNPFLPLMPVNQAGIAWRCIREDETRHIAVLLRPCELRALVELMKRAKPHSTDLHQRVLLMGVDCIGTYSKREYRSLSEHTSPVDLTRQALQDAAEGGLRMCAYRTACRLCEWPAPRGADIVIGTIGVETTKHLLVIAHNEALDDCLRLGDLTDGSASEYMVAHRETVVGAVADTRAAVRKTLLSEMAGGHSFADLGNLLAWFANCDLCGSCLSACPLYDGELDGLFGRGMERSPLSTLVLVSHWIASCSGCGMCEEACARQVPLALLVSALSQRVCARMGYHAGDPALGLPWGCNRSAL